MAEFGSFSATGGKKLSSEKKTWCPDCGTGSGVDAKTCGKCGYNFKTGKSKKKTSKEKKRKSAAASTETGGGSLLLGTLLSFIGATLGAIAWGAIGAVTQYEITFLAIIVGGLAGGGMAIAYDRGDGFVPGLISAVFALYGLVLGKVLIVVFVVLPMIATFAGAFGPREQLVAYIVEERVEQLGNVDVSDSQYARFETDAESKVTAMSDEEVQAELDAYVAAEEAEWATLEQQAEAGTANQPVTDNQVETGDLDVEFVDSYEGPGLLALFFSSMFSPIDALFIILGLGAAYRVGSGAAVD